ncbi:hypothetical protein EMCRGX_G020756 [Ephydatia muelleri]
MGNSHARRSGEYITESTKADSRQLATYGVAGNAEGDGAPLVAIRPDPDNTARAGEIDEDENGNRTLEQDMTPKERRRATAILWYRRIKTVSLTSFLLVLAILFAVRQEKEAGVIIADVEAAETIQFFNGSDSGGKYTTVTLSGPFVDSNYHNTSVDCSQFLFLCGPTVLGHEPGDCPSHDIDGKVNCQSVQIAQGTNTGIYKTVSRTLSTEPGVNFHINFFTNYAEGVAFTFSVQDEVLTMGGQVSLAFLILVVVYLLIGFEIVHRTIAALIGSTFVLAVLSMLEKRPTLETVVSWIDLETVCLLVGMMALVGIFSKTGFFDYAAVKAYKVARGREWPLIILLCGFTAFVSAFLDNVTTILLIVPVTIRLCQVLNLDPRPVLIAEVLFSNIGGTGTAVGDPPNIIIVAHDSIQAAGIGFAEFTAHMLLGIALPMVAAYTTIAIMYSCCKYVKWRNDDEESRIAELKREIRMWERAEKTLPTVTGEEKVIQEALRAKTLEVRKKLRDERRHTVQERKKALKQTLYELEQKYCITDKVLLVKSFAVVAVVIVLFFLSGVIPNFLGLGWIAIFGAVILIVLSGIKDLEEVMHKIEWSTLLFFAGLFIMMKGLTQLGLLAFIGDKLVQVIKFVPPANQNLVGIILILWVSAFVSAFIDNIPFVTAMIPVIVELADSQDVCIDLKPMVFALAFGGCLGGNATLIGASANVVCAGIAEQNGYKITFKDFMKIGMPVMITTVFSAMVYLLIVHIGFGWNITACPLT